LYDCTDVYAEKEVKDELQIKTHYEKLDIAKSKRVHYLQFDLKNTFSFEADEQLKQLLIEQESD
jgi:tRNA (guanine-N7-)-methyltransferase